MVAVVEVVVNILRFACRRASAPPIHMLCPWFLPYTRTWFRSGLFLDFSNVVVLYESAITLFFYSSTVIVEIKFFF